MLIINKQHRAEQIVQQWKTLADQPQKCGQFIGALKTTHYINIRCSEAML